MTPCTCNTDMGDTCPKCAPPAKVAPPKVGDKWGDLSPEQRAMVPVGTELSEPSDAPPCAYQPRVKVTADPYGYQWAERMGCVPIDRDESLIRDRRITRLGPAPTTEPDQSGWPEIAADIMALEEKIGADADPRDAEIAHLRTQVQEFRTAACVATGWGEDTSPGDATLIETLRGGQWVRRSEALSWVKELEEGSAALRNRAEKAEATIAELRASLATALRDANEADNECADLRRALEGQTHANAPLRDALSTLRGRLAFVLPDGPVTDEALVAAVRKLADREGDEAMLTAGLGLLDQAAFGNPTLAYIATVIRRGVGR